MCIKILFSETSAEKFLSASSDWQVKSVGEEQIGRDNEENNDIVIKSEPVWDDENEEFYNVMNGVSVGKRNNNSTTVDNVPKFSIEESSCGDLPENEEYIEDPYSVPKHEEEWSEGIDNAEDPSIGKLLTLDSIRKFQVPQQLFLFIELFRKL